MATAESTLDCAKHPGQPAAGRCDHCGAPFCGDCRVEDTAAEEVFCSEPCREKRTKARSGPALPSESVLLEGFDQPIRTGWKLWSRSLPAICLYTAPIAFIMGMVAWLGGESLAAEGGETTVSGGAGILILLMLAFGIALTQVILSQRYTRLVQGDPYAWTLRRFIPWTLSWIVCLAAIVLGMLALLVPGIILALRLFWADEFALVHRAGPIQALKESWKLTRGDVGSLFVFQFLAGLAAYVVLIPVGALLLAFMALVQLLGISEYLGPLGLALVYLMIFVGYAGLHGPEIVYFYGMRAEQSRSLVGSTKVLDVT